MTTPEKGKHGGARPGAGRPPSHAPIVEMAPTDDEKAFLRDVMNDNSIDLRIRVDAAKALLRGSADVGKKAAKGEAAKKAAAGKFAPTAPPLKLVGQQQ